MSDKELKEIESRMKAASVGPWKVVERGALKIENYDFGDREEYRTTTESDAILTSDNREVIGCSEWMRWTDEDAQFVAHSRKDIESLLAEVKRLKVKKA